MSQTVAHKRFKITDAVERILRRQPKTSVKDLVCLVQVEAGHAGCICKLRSIQQTIYAVRRAMSEPAEDAVGDGSEELTPDEILEVGEEIKQIASRIGVARLRRYVQLLYDQET